MNMSAWPQTSHYMQRTENHQEEKDYYKKRVHGSNPGSLRVFPIEEPGLGLTALLELHRRSVLRMLYLGSHTV